MRLAKEGNNSGDGMSQSSRTSSSTSLNNIDATNSQKHKSSEAQVRITQMSTNTANIMRLRSVPSLDLPFNLGLRFTRDT
jgi:uncharacterized protein YceK